MNRRLRNRIGRFAVILATFAMLTTATPAASIDVDDWFTNPREWDEAEVNWRFHGVDGTLDTAAFRARFRDAMNTWTNEIPDLPFAFDEEPELHQAFDPWSDSCSDGPTWQDIQVYTSANTTDSNLAKARLCEWSPDKIGPNGRSEIRFSLIGFRNNVGWDTTTNGTGSGRHLESTAAHEIGHAMGLSGGHPPAGDDRNCDTPDGWDIFQSTMCTSVDGDCDRSTLSIDDIGAMTDLYGIDEPARIVDVDVGIHPNGKMQLFYSDMDGILWTHDMNSCGFSERKSLGGGVSQIDTGLTSTGRMVVFAVRNGGVQHRSTTATNGTNWNGWWSHGGSGIQDVAAAENADGRLEVFRLTSSGTVQNRWQTTPNGSWNASWGTVSSTTGRVRITAEQNDDGRLVVYALADCSGGRFGTCEIENIAQSCAGCGWASSWTLRGTSKEADVDAAVDTLGRIVIASRQAAGGPDLVVLVQQAAGGSGGYSDWDAIDAALNPWFDAVAVERFEQTPWGTANNEWGDGPGNRRAMFMTGDPHGATTTTPTDIVIGAGSWNSAHNPVNWESDGL
ncbi:MAG: hypothetical protein AAGA90_07880 [Actinomycetota bacterium]